MAAKNHLVNKNYPKTELDERDWHVIRAMCSIQCTGEEISSVIGISYSTLKRRIEETYGVNFEQYYKKESKAGLPSLRHAQWQKALEGNTAMLIWLGKQYLNQKDSPETIQTEPIQLLYSLDDKEK